MQRHIRTEGRPGEKATTTTNNIQTHTGYHLDRVHTFILMTSTIFDPGVRLSIFYVFLASHFVTVIIDNIRQQLRGYDAIPY